MKVAYLNEKENEKRGLYEMMEVLPPPPRHIQLTQGQIMWWYWMGKLLVKTNNFAELDLIHLQAAAVALDARNKLYKAQNVLNEKSINGIGGLIQTYANGVQQIHAMQTAIEKQNKILNDISGHFGLSIRDRKKLETVKQTDENQTDLFKEFEMAKTN